MTAGALERATAAAADAAAAYRPLARAHEELRGGSDDGARRARDAARAVDDDLASALRADVVATEAVDEVKELATCLVLRLLGPIHKDDVVAVISIVEKWVRGPEALLKHVAVEDLHKAILAPIAQLAALLAGGLQKRKVDADATPLAAYANGISSESQVPSEDASAENVEPQHAGMSRSVSTSGLAQLGSSLLAESSEVPGASPRAGRAAKYSLSSTKYVNAPAPADDGRNDPFRDALRDKLRQVLTGAKGCVNKGGGFAQEVLDRLTFVLANERGFFWDASYAGSCVDALALDAALCCRLASKLKNLITTPQRKTEPKGPEATRRLTFFVNSLLMDLPPPPPLDAAVSLTTLTPFYSEDVILSAGDLRRKNADGVTTLLYLQTLYKADWHAFLERRGLSETRAHAECFSPAHVYRRPSRNFARRF